jgi:UDP-N-acetylmuramoyl-tripeptide--D-alanyl-D-alanine ligase
MENITIQDILEATDGTLLCGDPSMKIDHLSTNSMEIGPNTLFVPIIGERVDAHIFIPNALKEGGACLTQEHTEASGNAPYIKVPDTLTAMQQIAAYYRNKMSLPIIGVTGSVGKTT